MNKVKHCIEQLEHRLDDLEGLWQGKGRREERQRKEEIEQEASRGQRTELELAIKTVTLTSFIPSNLLGFYYMFTRLLLPVCLSDEELGAYQIYYRK